MVEQSLHRPPHPAADRVARPEMRLARFASGSLRLHGARQCVPAPRPVFSLTVAPSAAARWDRPIRWQTARRRRSAEHPTATAGAQPADKMRTGYGALPAFPRSWGGAYVQAVPVTSRSQQPWRRAASRAPIRVGSHGLQRVPRFDLSFPERVHCFPLRSTHKRPLQSPGARRGRGRDQQLFTYHALLGPILRLHKLIPGSRVRHKQCAVPPRGCLRGRPNGRSHRYDSPRGWRLRLRAGAVRAVACAGYRPRGAYDHSLPCAADARLTLPAPEQCFRRPSSERSEAKTTRQAAENDSPLLSMRKHFSFLVF